MIVVSIITAQEQIMGMSVSGHSGYADKGSDLVCAGVSSIAIGTLNALDLLTKDQCQLEMNDNLVRIKVLRNSPEVQLILQTADIQLKTLSEKYGSYLTIKQTEV
ncbi:hypothetical protein SDC9_100220 [bioreactor metagenome]|uniref:Ribosomal-processing cysteine protease Prp n=1 Tax=bioreactor metagenome TaxID=1076179 RepID=A0A645AJR1_9ZZZZ